MKALPVWKGYTIDFRLREFRKVEHMEFIPFDSPKGMKLMEQYKGELGGI